MAIKLDPNQSHVELTYDAFYENCEKVQLEMKLESASELSHWHLSIGSVIPSPKRLITIKL